MMLRRTVRNALFLMAGLSLVSCSEHLGRPDPTQLYLPRTSEANVLNNLQQSYKDRSTAEYSKLLATDFQFYFDEGTRQQNGTLPVFWSQYEDSTQTEALFSNQRVTEIRIDLQFGTPRPDVRAGHETWTSVDVLDTFLEVELNPAPGNPSGLILRVDGQKQKFYFRRGRTPDSAASDSLWYITEWRDLGNLEAPRGLPGRLAVEPTTWSRIKTTFR